MFVYRNTHPDWLLNLLKNGHIDAGERFISFSLDPDSGGQDNYGSAQISFDRASLDKQGLEEIYYEKDYFEQNPDISRYVTGFCSEQDYYTNQEFNNAEEAHEQHKLSWEDQIESYEGEEELVLKELKYENGIINNVLFKEKPSDEILNLLDQNNISYQIQAFESFKTFEDYKSENYERWMIKHLDGKIIEKYPETIPGTFDCSLLELTSLENSPKYVGRDFNCHNNKLTSLEGGPVYVKHDYRCSHNQLTDLKGSPNKCEYFDCSNNLITSLEGSPKECKHINFIGNKNLETLYGAPEGLEVISNYEGTESKKLTLGEYLAFKEIMNNKTYKKEKYYEQILDVLLVKDKYNDIAKIKWPERIIKKMPESLKNLVRSGKSIDKFNLFEKTYDDNIYYNVLRFNKILRFEEFVLESLKTIDGSLDLSENIKTNTAELLSSIDIEEVDVYKTLNLLIDDVNIEGMDLEQLADNNHFLNGLEKMLLKKEEVKHTGDIDTFLTVPIAFMGIYPIQVLEIQDPEFLLVQIRKSPIKLYKVKGSIKKFYDKLTSKTIEIKKGIDNWIYRTSNSGNNWELLNKEMENDIFKQIMSTQELEDSIEKEMTIQIIS